MLLRSAGEALAGNHIYFSDTLLEVREANETELQHGHVHEHGDHSHH